MSAIRKVARNVAKVRLRKEGYIHLFKPKKDGKGRSAFSTLWRRAVPEYRG